MRRVCSIARFDTYGFICEIVNVTPLNIVKDGACRMYKGVINIFRCLGRSFEEDQLVTLGKLKTLFIRDFAFVLEIFLVSYKHNGHSLIGVLKHLFEPADKVLESISTGDVIDEKGANGTTVVGPGDAPKRFLASSVPDL